MRQFKSAGRQFGKKHWPTKAVDVNFVGMTSVPRLSSFTIGMTSRKILDCRLEDIREAGIKSEKNWTNAFFSVQIVIERFMREKQRFQATGSVKPGEFREP